MKILLSTLIVLSLVLLNEDRFINSVWTYKVSSNCINKLTFKGGKNISEFDCEMNYTFNGTYKIYKDTLYVSLKDDSHSEDGGKPQYLKYKYLIKGSTLKFIGRYSLSGKSGITENTESFKNVIYTRVK